MIILTRGCSLFLVSNVPAPSIDLWEWVPDVLGTLHVPAMALRTTLPSKMASRVFFFFFKSDTVRQQHVVGGRINSLKSAFDMRGGELLKYFVQETQLNSVITNLRAHSEVFVPV